MKSFILLVACVFFHNVDCFSVSVPPIRSVCRTMVPGHDKYQPQNITASPSPFSVVVDQNSVAGGDTVDITLFGNDGKQFIGYYLQARDSKNSPVGMFNPNSLAKTHSCGGIRGNAAHHANPEKKDKVKISWKAPKKYQGDIQFYATFVENYVTFWTMVKAPEVVKVTS